MDKKREVCVPVGLYVGKSRSDVRNIILESSAEDWEFIDMPQTWVHWPERITIRTQTQILTDSTRDIEQPDFVHLPDPEHDKEMQVRLLHQGTPFDQRAVMRLNGGKYTIVQPEYDDSDDVRYLSAYEAQLSQIMSHADFHGSQGITIDVEIRGEDS